LQQRNAIPDSGIRMTLTGGYSVDGYTLSQPNLIITQKPLDTGITPICAPPIRLVTYPHCRQMPDTKTIDYLMAIWLQPYIRQHDAGDVLYHLDGIVSECPRSNFFIVTADDTIVTPGKNILRGITRMKILEVATARFRVEERDVTLEDIRKAKEAFIASTTNHVRPVSHVDGHPRTGHVRGRCVCTWHLRRRPRRPCTRRRPYFPMAQRADLPACRFPEIKCSVHMDDFTQSLTAYKGYTLILS
jgi:D-alanine transaminase/branched-chain amino acid aminotransferase